MGRSHPRKNLYLADLSKAEAHDRKRIRTRRDKHPYMIAYRAFLSAEQEFLSNLKSQLSCLKKDKACSLRLTKLKQDLYVATKEAEFYEKYQNIDYRAYGIYQLASLKKGSLPDLMSALENDSPDFLVKEQELEKKISHLKQTIPVEKENLKDRIFRHIYRIFR